MNYDEQRRKLIEYLISIGYLKSKSVIEAMLKVPRHLFVPEEYRAFAYDDRPLPIGFDQTISAPHMVALMCEHLDLKPNHKVLEIGAGSGYHACVIGCIVKEGKVIAVERIKELAEKAKENIKKVSLCKNVKIVVGDGTKGYEKEAPYDRILVTAGAPSLPEPLIKQLKIGGKMLIPIGKSKYSQELYLIIKIDKNKIEKKNLGDVAFVPLVGEYGWKD